jgi:serine/threonine-protein phosphatase 2B regulatory subunit
MAFIIYDMDNDGYLSNGDLFKCLKMLVGDNLTDIQIQQLVDRSIIAADKDLDGKISYEEFTEFVKDMKIGEMFSMKLFG